MSQHASPEPNIERTSAPARCVDVAVGIICHNGLVLVARRPQDVVLGGLWEFPGGKLLEGETPQCGAERELFEELGVAVVAHTVWRPIEHHYGHAHVRIHPVLCRLVQGEVRPLASQEIRWVPVAELASLPMPEANGTLVQQIARLLPRP